MTERVAFVVSVFLFGVSCGYAWHMHSAGAQAVCVEQHERGELLITVGKCQKGDSYAFPRE